MIFNSPYKYWPAERGHVSGRTESVSKQPTQLFVKLNSSLRQKLGTIVDFWFLFSSKDGNPLSADDIKIRCGEYDLKLGEIDQYDYQDRNVDTFTIHPFFSGMETLRNDIALIHTKEAFKQAR